MAGFRVVKAYGGIGDSSVERAVLAGIGAELIEVEGLGSDGARAAAREADALMVTLQPVPADLIAGMGRCRIICRAGTGVDAIDIPAATERGIWVTNVPDYAIDEVSTHALALLLAMARNLRGHLDAARQGEWRYQAVSPIRRFAGQTLGILGYGRIGSATARKGLGLGLRVIACDPYVPTERMTEAGVEPVDWATLLRESDYLSLHVPLTHETRRMVDAPALALMKPTAYLVNTARGEVVVGVALLEAVRSGRLAGAALDVLATEPPDPHDPLLRDDRILVTPHVAWASEEASVDVRKRAAEDVVRVLRGGRPRTPVNEVGVVSEVTGPDEFGGVVRVVGAER